MTGHGGDEFLKFQDQEEIASQDLADAFAQMHEKQRYNELLFITDTCQANTLYSHIYSPGVIAVGSSEKGENSYSHHGDQDIGVAVIDRFTYYALEYLNRDVADTSSSNTLQQLFQSLSPGLLMSHAGVRTDLSRRDISDVRVTDFFGSVVPVQLTRQLYPVEGAAPAYLTSEKQDATRNARLVSPSEYIALRTHGNNAGRVQRVQPPSETSVQLRTWVATLLLAAGGFAIGFQLV